MKKIALPTLARNGRFLGFGTSAKRDWKIVFIASLIAALLVISYCVYLFINLGNSEASIERGQVAPQGLVNEKLLKRVVTYYSEKGTNLEKIKTTKETIPDPSI